MGIRKRGRFNTQLFEAMCCMLSDRYCGNLELVYDNICMLSAPVFDDIPYKSCVTFRFESKIYQYFDGSKEKVFNKNK